MTDRMTNPPESSSEPLQRFSGEEGGPVTPPEPSREVQRY
jgi:hypothetical protein